MQVVHEFGHVLGAWATGGKVVKVVLSPVVFSRTEVAPNPHPLTVVWAGPVVGCLLPALALLIAKAARCPVIYLFRFFAGFCFVANGVYIAGGSFLKSADPGNMLQFGSPQWSLILFGSVAFSIGLFLWHRQGVYFGFSESGGKVHPLATVASLTSLTLLVLAELIYSSR
jgi:hypothetical protein